MVRGLGTHYISFLDKDVLRDSRLRCHRKKDQVLINTNGMVLDFWHTCQSTSNSHQPILVSFPFRLIHPPQRTRVGGYMQHSVYERSHMGYCRK